MQGEKLEIASLIEDWKKKLSDSFDVTFRQIYIKEKECWIVFLSSLSDGVLVACLLYTSRCV